MSIVNGHCHVAAPLAQASIVALELMRSADTRCTGLRRTRSDEGTGELIQNKVYKATE